MLKRIHIKIGIKSTIFLLFLIPLLFSCSMLRSSSDSMTVEEAEIMLIKQKKKQTRRALKEKKKRYKAYWDKQTKYARRSIKRNLRNQRRREKGKDPIQY
jgi:hypothetical protein